MHMKELCLAGLGAGLLPKSIILDELKNKKLVSLLSDLPYLDFDLCVFCRADDYSNPKIRSFMDLF